ncbi:MAG: hypothetical protein IKX88_10625, partial [Thermoguttaceae bacterium]|nr:hypothetical protein [Thermoguttaceae bacterium]
QAILAIAPFVVSYAGFIVSSFKRKIIATEAFLFAGCGFFFLVTSYMFATYSKWYDDAWLPYVWFFAALTTSGAAFFSRSKALHGLAVFYIGAWIYFTMFDRWNVVPFDDKGCFLTLPFIALGFYWSYRRATETIGAAYYLLFAFWTFGQFIAWDINDHNSFKISFFLPCAILMASSSLALFGFYCRRIGLLSRNFPFTACLVVLITLPFLTYVEHYECYVYRQANDYCLSGYVLELIGIALTILSLALLWKTRRPDGAATKRPIADALGRLFSPEGVGIASLQLAGAITWWFWLAALPASGRAECSLAPYLALYANILMVGVAARFIWLGAKGRPLPFWIGVVYFIVWMFLRMFSLSSMFHGDSNVTAIFFFFAVAVALFGASWFFNRLMKNKPAVVEVEEEVAPRAPVDVMSERALKIGLGIAILAQFALAFFSPFF